MIGNIGGVGAWLTGPARVAFVIGLDRYFPPAFGRVAPALADALRRDPDPGGARHAVPAASRSSGKGTTVERAYLVILDTMLLVYFIPYIYLFVCYLVVRLREPATTVAPVLARRAKGTGHRPRGLGLTLFAMFIATVPPAGTDRSRAVPAQGASAEPRLLRRCSVACVYWRGPTVRSRRGLLPSRRSRSRSRSSSRRRRGAARARAPAGEGPPPVLLPRDVHPAGDQRTQRRRPGRPTGTS